jgi:hypothetical protein
VLRRQVLGVLACAGLHGALALFAPALRRLGVVARVLFALDPALRVGDGVARRAIGVLGLGHDILLESSISGIVVRGRCCACRSRRAAGVA